MRHPDLCRWLEQEQNLRTTYRYKALVDEWRAFSSSVGQGEEPAELLRRWRRLMSLRIAYRSVNGLADEPTTVAELTRLAEFCIRSCLDVALRRWRDRLGEPWDEAAGRPARFGVLALGKLGGGELNFSSDVDLVYAYDGEGFCLKDGAPAPTSNAEWFTKVAETTTRMLSESTADGFLFRVDARLRPEGAWGPLVHSLSALENHYAASGQTWERLALLKARPVAGDLALGGELLEDLHAFRYPRRPPPSLLAEVAAMKRRTEREVVGESALKRDVKLGPGGIREIEFIAQSLQLLHAGAYPFLQTHSTVAALEGLARYRLLDAEEARSLCEAYWFLRRVEHRVQMRDERQTHELPEDPAELEAVALSLGFPGSPEFLAELERLRDRVHALFAALFKGAGEDAEFEQWWDFLTSERVPGPIGARLARWFGAAPGAAEALRLFACGDRRQQVAPELVRHFQALAAAFDRLTPELARPLETLARLARCAERYGTRQQFLNSCASNPSLLRVLALLCDRSGYAAELLCAHPEIVEEVLRPEILRRRKSRREIGAELAGGPAGDPEWLWLYLRAEQMRYVIGELLGFLSLEQVEAALTRLADAAIERLVVGCPALVVALGKYGGAELAFGSDLDLLVVSAEADGQGAEAALDRLRGMLGRGGPLGPAFALDLRLRPHGNDGPATTTLGALDAYHQPGGGGQGWERQVLLRARVVAGPPALAEAFGAWVLRNVYGRPPDRAEQEALWSMRARIERERDAGVPTGRAVKTGAGGLLDVEFLAQALQWRQGAADASLRTPGTRSALRALGRTGHLPETAAETLAADYDCLKRIEFALRRDANRGVSVLPPDAADRTALARWLGWDGEDAFRADTARRMAEIRALTRTFGGAPAQSALPS